MDVFLSLAFTGGTTIMAQMHPVNGPKGGTPSNAERHLYRLMRDLPEHWHVIHNVGRLTKVGRGKPIEGEIDFLIINPDRGILVLEVKGGRIAYDDATGKWTTTDRDNKTHALRPSPFNQVSASLHFLKEFIERTPELKGQTYPLGRAVWFSDITWRPRHLLEFPDELILDSTSMTDPLGALELAFTVNGIRDIPGTLSPEAVARFMAHLLPAFPPPTMHEAITIDQRLLDLLTAEQSLRLTHLLQTHRQCAIPGEAGTGKTILAFETARLLSRSSWRTLLVCVNAFQAYWLKEKQDAECDITRNEQFDIYDIADLCSQYARRTGSKDVVAAEQVVEARGQNQMARLLQRSIERLQHADAPGDWQYDAVLIDEGQDVEKPLLSAISHLLRDRHKGYFCIWYDAYSMQSLLHSHESRLQQPLSSRLTPILTPILNFPHCSAPQTSHPQHPPPAGACLA
jgi:hypothetical protein